MTISISQHAFTRLDVVTDHHVSVGELRHLDKDKNGTVSKDEAATRGIRNPKDINAINQALKIFEGSEPVQMAFNTEGKLADPGVIYPPEEKALERQFGKQHGEKPGFAKAGMKIGDVIFGSVGFNAVRDNAATIRTIADKYNINPMMLAAVVYEETAHQMPPLIEDQVTCGIKDNRCSIGLTQCGAGELIKQGWFAAEGIPPTASDKQLTPAQLQRARDYLSVPANNLEVMAKKIVRLQEKLGHSPGETRNERSYNGAHAIAQITFLHNGYTDYAPRILHTMKDTQLRALMGLK